MLLTTLDLYHATRPLPQQYLILTLYFLKSATNGGGQRLRYIPDFFVTASTFRLFYCEKLAHRVR